MKNKSTILLIFILIFAVSCTVDEGCRKSKTVNMGIGFYQTVLNTSTQKMTKTALSIDSLSIQGLGVDSMLYNKSKKISKVILPLNKFALESRFVVTFDTTKDTITVTHTNTDDFLSLECGCIKTHTIDTVLTTNHFIDSVKIAIHDVNTTNAEHLQIYK